VVASTVSGATKLVLSAVYDFFESYMNTQSRRDVIERLNNLTDVELATRYGINRDGIVAYVFRDKMF
jgi:hypothetical protein